MENQTLICGLDTTQIEELKAEKGALVLIEVTAQGKVHQAVFREPTFEMLRASNKISKTDDMKALESIYNNCKIAVDDDIAQRDVLKIKAVEALMARVQKTSSEAKNL